MSTSGQLIGLGLGSLVLGYGLAQFTHVPSARYPSIKLPLRTFMIVPDLPQTDIAKMTSRRVYLVREKSGHTTCRLTNRTMRVKRTESQLILMPSRADLILVATILAPRRKKSPGLGLVDADEGGGLRLCGQPGRVTYGTR